MRNILYIICSAFVGFLKFFNVLLLLAMYLPWFRNFNFYKQPLYSIRLMTNPYLEFFKGLLPIFMGIDLGPYIAFLALRLITTFFESLII